MTGALNDLATDSIAGGTALLSGGIGDIVVFGGIIAIVLLVVYAFYRLIQFGRSRS